jgi:protein-tyrosine phosphatase
VKASPEGGNQSPRLLYVVVLFLCTANVCRSPMAAALFSSVAADLDRPATDPAVAISAGLLEEGRPVLPEVVTVLSGYGLDLSGHRSRQMTATDVGEADLVLGMERRHGREAVLLVPSALGRTFTLKDLVRRGEKSGPRGRVETLDSWLETVGQGREKSSLIGRSADDDVADPLGGVLADYRATAAEIADLVERLARLLGPEPSGWGPDVPIAR